MIINGCSSLSSVKSFNNAQLVFNPFFWSETSIHSSFQFLLQWTFNFFHAAHLWSFGLHLFHQNWWLCLSLQLHLWPCSPSWATKTLQNFFVSFVFPSDEMFPSAKQTAHSNTLPNCSQKVKAPVLRYLWLLELGLWSFGPPHFDLGFCNQKLHCEGTPAWPRRPLSSAHQSRLNKCSNSICSGLNHWQKINHSTILRFANRGSRWS